MVHTVKGNTAEVTIIIEVKAPDGFRWRSEWLKNVK
jgi:hypothetical protein